MSAVSWAQQLRPTRLEDMVGNAHLVGPQGVLTSWAASGEKRIPSLILYGPPGVGKTTAATIMASSLNRECVRINATQWSTTQVREAIKKHDQLMLYVDEIQYLTSKQQQILLPYCESGRITLIAATTDNPYHALSDALLSRCTVMEFQRPSVEEITQYLTTLAHEPTSPLYGISIQVINVVAQACHGDIRRALGDLECAMHCVDTPQDLTVEHITQLAPTMRMASFDTQGDAHYAYISALHKSIRGSDPDAAVFWLCKLVMGGDILSPIRRLLAIACEDIGLADPYAITHTLSCAQAAQQLGIPEAFKPLTQATLYLALAPKSASNEPAWMSACEDIRQGLGATVPAHIASTHAPGYVWPQDRPAHWWPQQYLPDDCVNQRYYRPDSAWEQRHVEHWSQVKDWFARYMPAPPEE